MFAKVNKLRRETSSVGSNITIMHDMDMKALISLPKQVNLSQEKNTFYVSHQ